MFWLRLTCNLQLLSFNPLFLAAREPVLRLRGKEPSANIFLRTAGVAKWQTHRT
jgi:hypothetical protein